MENKVKPLSSRLTGVVITVIFLLLIIFFKGSLYCQIKTSTGSSQVRMESNITKTQAREQAKHLAIINAIENQFGTYVEQETDMVLDNGKLSYNIIGTTKVKGEWIETLQLSYTEDSRTIKAKQGVEYEIWITCKIKGRVKKVSPKANLLIQTLNCPNIKCRTTSFLSGESLYLYFKSPVDGYLCVFLEEKESIYRLLPYDKMTKDLIKSVYVKADMEYIFFTKEQDYFKGSTVDEFELFASENIEYSRLHVVFAEQTYVKPLLNQSEELDEYKKGYRLPKSLKKSDFERWLIENRSSMDSFQNKKVKLSISK